LFALLLSGQGPVACGSYGTGRGKENRPTLPNGGSDSRKSNMFAEIVRQLSDCFFRFSEGLMPVLLRNVVLKELLELNPESSAYASIL